MARPTRSAFAPLSHLSLATAAAVMLALVACGRRDDPRAALDRYFRTAIRQDYAATYECYDAAYHSKVSRDDFVRHRKEASPLESYRIVSIDTQGDRATAEVALVFGALPKAGRAGSASTTVHEDLVREASGWRIRVW